MEDSQTPQNQSPNSILPIWKTYPIDIHNPNDPSISSCQLVAVYKNKIIVYGNDTWQQNDDSNIFLHLYCIQQKQWMKNKIRSQNENIKHFRGMYGAMVGSRYFVFGQQNKNKDELAGWRINMEASQWLEIDQKGQIPPLTEGGSLVHYQKHWLVYLPGHQNGSFDNQLYLYNVDTKYWYICQGNYRYSLRARYQTSMAVIGDKIYLYGGYGQGIDGVEVLDDFWEVKIRVPHKGNPPSASALRINSLARPEGRAEHMLVVNNRDLCLVGGRNQKGFQKSIWNFNIIDQEWSQAGLLSDNYLDREGYSFVQQNDTIWILGDYSLSQTPEKSSALLNLTLQTHESNLSGKHIRVDQGQKYSQNCLLCYENRFDIISKVEPFSCQLIDNLKQSLEFPFAAFSLLTDNSLSIGADKVVISVEGDRGHQWFRVQDNGQIQWTQEQLVDSLSNYCHQINFILSGCDKKTKKQLTRQRSIRQYGVNLKLGGLRLGKRLLFVSHCSSKVYVFLISKRDSQDSGHYQIEYYSMDTTLYEVTRQQMIANRISIESKYNRYIKTLLQDRAMKNTLFIFDSIINESSQNINLDLQTNDIIYGQPSHIQNLKAMGFKMEQSVDVSFKAYLSYLYLRNDYCQISLVIGRIVSHVSLQNSMEKIDKMTKTHQCIELDSLVEFDFKLEELFYMREQRQYSHFFSNGVLLYEQNRLVSRVRPKLGTILTHMHSEVTQYCNYIPLFGFIQLPQTIPLNIFKTNFTFDLMLDRMLSRFKFIEKTFNKNIKTVIAKAHSEAHHRRERIQQSMMPTKQLSRRSRGHYGQRNWDELPDRFELSMTRKRVTNKKPQQQQVSHEPLVQAEDPADADQWKPNRQLKQFRQQ